MKGLTRQPLLREFIAITDFEAARQWYRDRAEEVGDPYSLAKEAINTWTQVRAPDLIGQDIRINCTMPSPIDTPMLGEFRSEEHTSELQSLMRISYAVFCLKKKKINKQYMHTYTTVNKSKLYHNTTRVNIAPHSSKTPPKST